MSTLVAVINEQWPQRVQTDLVALQALVESSFNYKTLRICEALLYWLGKNVSTQQVDLICLRENLEKEYLNSVENLKQREIATNEMNACKEIFLKVNENCSYETNDLNFVENNKQAIIELINRMRELLYREDLVILHGVRNEVTALFDQALNNLDEPILPPPYMDPELNHLVTILMHGKLKDANVKKWDAVNPFTHQESVKNLIREENLKQKHRFVVEVPHSLPRSVKEHYLGIDTPAALGKYGKYLIMYRASQLEQNSYFLNKRKQRSSFSILKKIREWL